MKRILVFLSVLLYAGIASAKITIPAGVVGSCITKHFTPADVNGVAAAREYRDMVLTGSGVTVDGLYRVCVAGGLDINKPEGKTKCRTFVQELITLGAVKYYRVCNADKGKSGGKEFCINDFFTNKAFGGTQVDIRTARGLASEYIRIKHKDKNVVCAETSYPCGPGSVDDCLTCTSPAIKTYYDFVFDDAAETSDVDISMGIESSLCRIHGTEYQHNSPGAGGRSFCETKDKALCAKISDSAKRFGYSASIVWNDGPCILRQTGPTSKSRLRTAFGIDNMAFRNGAVQLNANSALDSQIKTFVISEIAPTKLTSFKCNNASTSLYDFSGMVTETDDVLTCYVNGQPVDFLFDDLSESWAITARGGAQGMDCIVSGGTFTGKNCTHLTEIQCKKLAEQNIANCPECKVVQWDATNQICVLPSSTSATNLDKGLKITGTVVGGALSVVGSVALIATTAPVSGFVAVATIVLEVGSIVGTAIEVGSQIQIDKQAQEFLIEIAKCNSQSCAEKHFAESFQRMANLAPDFTDTEINAIDSEFARLARLLPADSSIYTGGIQDNQLALTDPNSWEPEQVWRAVGVGLQTLPMVFATGVKIVDMVNKNGSRVVNIMDETTDVLKRGFAKLRGNKSTQSASDMASAALSGNRRIVADRTVLERLSGVYDVLGRHPKSSYSMKLGDLTPGEEHALREMLDGLGASGVTYVEKTDSKLGRVLQIRDKNYRADKLDILKATVEAKYSEAEDFINTFVDSHLVAEEKHVSTLFSDEITKASDRIANAQTIEEAEQELKRAQAALDKIRTSSSDTHIMLDELHADYDVFSNMTANIALSTGDQKVNSIDNYLSRAEDAVRKAIDALDEKRIKLDELARMKQSAIREADIEAAFATADARRTNAPEYITEPVTYFRRIDYTNTKSPDEIVQILKNSGINASTDASDKTAWVVNRAGTSGYELVSPFLSPDTAPQQFDAVNDLLARNGVDMVGAVAPTKISQIDPTVTTGISRTQARANIRNYFEQNPAIAREMGVSSASTDEELLKALVNKEMPMYEGEHFSNVMSTYSGEDVIFRGQKFATSDPGSTYANMAPKAGVTGTPLASGNIDYAKGFSGGVANVSIGGAGDSAMKVGKIKVDNRNAGFLNVVENNDKNVWYGNTDVESLTDTSIKGTTSQSDIWSETIITPQDNPVRDRYMVLNSKYYKLDDTRPEHRLIMDAFAPDLTKTYGAPMLQRIESVKSGMTDGVVETYDIDADVLKNLSGAK